MFAADDGATVKVGAWESHFPQASGLSPGQRVGLAIRADRIRIKPLTSTESVNLAGEIDAASYQGAAQVYLVRLDRIPGIRLAVRDGIQGGSDFRFSIGSRVQVGWHPGSVQILRI